jgi:hypothetical protein
MTEDQIAGLGPAFTQYLGDFRKCFPRLPTFGHLGTYCRGLLSDLPRKSVEPIALAAGTAVRTFQEFIADHVWDQDAVLERLQRRIVTEHLPAPGERGGEKADELGVIGNFAERHGSLLLAESLRRETPAEVTIVWPPAKDLRT